MPIAHDVFVGAKGRSRLAVLEGVADTVAVHDIISALADDQTVVMAALAATDGAETTLRELSRGSRLVKLPIDLFPSTSAVTR
jgi:adenine-specific DNA-methyltransferase